METPGVWLAWLRIWSLCADSRIVAPRTARSTWTRRTPARSASS